jgi:hypothetical protein
MAALIGPRANLEPIITVAVGTGMRMSEQLQMKRHQVDSVVISSLRDIRRMEDHGTPMNDE